MSLNKPLAIWALTCACVAASHAAPVVLPTDASQPGYGQWATFDVDQLSAVSRGVEWIDAADSLAPGFGMPLVFAFALTPGQQARLTIVDAGFAGDTFRVTDGGSTLGVTSAVARADFASAASVGADFDAALADDRFSRGVFIFGAGSHLVGGLLEQSVGDGGLPLNATVGALRLTVFAVPEPSAGALVLAGLAGVTLVGRSGRHGSRR